MSKHRCMMLRFD